MQFLQSGVSPWPAGDLGSRQEQVKLCLLAMLVPGPLLPSLTQALRVLSSPSLFHPHRGCSTRCGDRQAYGVLGPESGAIPRGDPTVGKCWVLRSLLLASRPAALTVETRVSGPTEACRLRGPELPARPSRAPHLLPRNTSGKSWALVINLAAAETSH